MSARKPDNWKRVASVSPGGKPYFYTREVSGCRQWVSWDRRGQTWAVSTLCTCHGDTFATVKSARDGKRYADEYLTGK